MKPHPVHVCLLKHPHGSHDWVYTSSGGGHMMDSWDDSGVERNQKWWHCPGIAGVDEPADDIRPLTINEVRAAYQRGAHPYPGDAHGPRDYQTQPMLGEAFDRWLREVQRAAWDQGFGNGVADQSRWQQTGIPDGNIRNPYLEER